MALIACYECGDEVSTSAAACPHCGAPVIRQPSIASIDTTTSKLDESNKFEPSAKQTHIGATHGKSVADKQRTSWTSKLNLWWISVLALVIGAGAIIFAAAIRISKAKNDSFQTVSFIDREGNTVSCASENRESCIRNAEHKGFVKLPELVAGITIDGTTKPFRIIDVKGTAAEAGVRKGDFLMELDGREITEPFSIVRIMSTKQIGDKLAVKVSRADRQLYFAYNVMRRKEPVAR